MGVPGGIEEGGHGADDETSWTERFNSPGPQWKAPGTGETLEGNPDGTVSVKGGNTFVVVEAIMAIIAASMTFGPRSAC